MEKLIDAVNRRVNPGGQKEVTIRNVRRRTDRDHRPRGRTEAEVERIERIDQHAPGSLEFRILANKRDDKDLIERAKAEPLRRAESSIDAGESAGLVGAGDTAAKKRTSSPAMPPSHAEKDRQGRRPLEVLVLKDIYNVTGAYLTKAEPDTDQTGKPCVGFNFNSRRRATVRPAHQHPPARRTSGFHTTSLGIILDGELYSAPPINSTITDQRTDHRHSFTQRASADELVNVLNAGSLPAALTKEPISKFYSGPTLGNDTIQKSTRAMIIACDPRAVVHGLVLSLLRHGGQSSRWC